MSETVLLNPNLFSCSNRLASSVVSKSTFKSMSKYTSGFSDDEVDDSGDDDYKPNDSLKPKKTTSKQSKKNVKPPTASQKPKKAVNPKNGKNQSNTVKRKKEMWRYNDDESTQSFPEIDEEYEEKEENHTDWKLLHDEKTNIVDTQKATIEKLMEENAQLQKRLLQELESKENDNNNNNNNNDEDEMTPDVVSEHDDEMTPDIVSENDEEIEKSVIPIITTTENLYDWFDVVNRSQELYHITLTELYELDKFIIPSLQQTTNPIHKSIAFPKQLLMLMDYILNGATIDEIVGRAKLPPKFVASLIDGFISNAARTLQKQTSMIMNQNLTEVYFKGKGSDTFYFLIDPKTGKIAKHKPFHSVIKFRIKWNCNSINISQANQKYSSDLLKRMSNLFRIMLKPEIITNRDTMPLIYAIWNKFKYC